MLTQEEKKEGGRMFDLEELNEETRGIVEAVRDEEGLEIQNVEAGEVIIITTRKREFTILPGGEGQGEELARESLEDGEFWKEAVSDDRTTSGLDDWVDEVLSIDGWESLICSYDGKVRYTTTTDGREVVYYRSN